MTDAPQPRSARRPTQGEHGTVLVAERDQTLADLVRAFLTEEGYGVTVVADTRLETIRQIADVWPPDYILLDGQHAQDFGASWDVAARIAADARPTRVLMFTGDLAAAAEARAEKSRRSRDFAAVVTKPLDRRQLLLVLRQWRRTGEARAAGDRRAAAGSRGQR